MVTTIPVTFDFQLTFSGTQFRPGGPRSLTLYNKCIVTSTETEVLTKCIIKNKYDNTSVQILRLIYNSSCVCNSSHGMWLLISDAIVISIMITFTTNILIKRLCRQKAYLNSLLLGIENSKYCTNVPISWFLKYIYESCNGMVDKHIQQWLHSIHWMCG